MFSTDQTFFRFPCPQGASQMRYMCRERTQQCFAPRTSAALVALRTSAAVLGRSSLRSMLLRRRNSCSIAGVLFLCMLALCPELSVLKPSQAIGNKHGEHRACVRVFALELGALNRQDTNMDIRIEFSFKHTNE